MKQHTGQKDTFEKNMRYRLKKYKKDLRELTMCQRWKRNFGMVSDAMNFLSAKQNRVEHLNGVKMNMMVCRDTEAREDGTEGLVSGLDDDTMKAAFGILSETTGCEYKEYRKTRVSYQYKVPIK
eukprot:6275840-Ditylum_brightwellii.AAC.1